MACLNKTLQLVLYGLFTCFLACGIEVGNPNGNPTPQKYFHIPKLSLHLEEQFKDALSDTEQMDLAVILKYNYFSQQTDSYRSDTESKLASCSDLSPEDLYSDSECYQVAIGKEGEILEQNSKDEVIASDKSSDPKAASPTEPDSSVIISKKDETMPGSSDPSGNKYDEYWKSSDGIAECAAGAVQTPCQFNSEDMQMFCEKVDSGTSIEMVCYDQSAPETWSPNVIEFQSSYILNKENDWRTTSEKSLNVLSSYQPGEVELKQFSTLAASFSKILRSFDADLDDNLTEAEADRAIGFVVKTLSERQSQ